MKKIEIRKEGDNKNRVIVENSNGSFDIVRLNDEQLKRAEKVIRDLIAENAYN